MGRAAALLGLLAALSVWYEVVPGRRALSLWPSALLISLLLIPAMFALLWLTLPLARSRLLGPLAAAAIALAVALSELDAVVATNFAKFAAAAAVGWLFLLLFLELSWVVAVAFIIPWVDAYSVWRGPTKAITTHHAAVFSKLSVAFVVPGGGAARLGLTDVMFFALFLATSARFGLRPFATWAAMTAGLALTMILTTLWTTGGLPALPGISLGFLLGNGDLIWRRLARGGQPSLEPGGG